MACLPREKGKFQSFGALRKSGLFFRLSLVTLFVFCGESELFSQSAATSASTSKFDVISVRPGDPKVSHGTFENIAKAGMFRANSANLDQLIGFAYDVRPFQIVGGPKWRGSDGFTIQAVADQPIPETSSGTQMFRTMLQALLADRFKLVVKDEMREGPVYELLVDRDGPRMKESKEPRGGISLGHNQLTGNSASTPLLARELSRVLGYTVIDKTGLAGGYDFSLKWQDDLEALGADAEQPNSSEPTIFTAIQENLGLKLKAAKGPVKYIVIENLEKPDAN